MQAAENRRRKKSRGDDKKKKKKSKSRSPTTDSDASPSGRDPESDGERQKRRERLKFKYMAKEKPGLVFASMTANSRQALGQYGAELDVGSHGPVYRRWWEGSFQKEHPRSKLEPYWDELTMLVTALDEFYAGRMIEVGDILASRLRMLTTGIEKGTWKAARHFLVYHTQDLSLIPEELMDEALKIEAAEARWEKRLAVARSGKH